MTVNHHVKDKATGQPILGARVRYDDLITGQTWPRTSDGAGYSNVSNVQPNHQHLHTVQADGYETFSEYVTLPGVPAVDVVVELTPGFKVPSMEQRAAIRGAMWTARAALPWGPRPGQPDNCLCVDYMESYSDADQARLIQAYRGDRHYTHAPMGPLVAQGYHGQLPDVDGRADPSAYFAGARRLERAGVHVIHFLRPDRGTVGLDWTVDDLERELGPLFRTPEAQQLMHTVCLGWEPGPQYYYDNAWWVAMCQWMAATFPKALRLIHMTADTDSPVGGDDDKRHITNGQGWANVARYLHGFLAQYGGYIDGQSVADFSAHLAAAIRDLQHRFATGEPDGTWPTSSAWGAGQPIRVYAGEFASYRDYWYNAPEEEARTIGDAALAAGAAGSLDGCHV